MSLHQEKQTYKMMLNMKFKHVVIGLILCLFVVNDSAIAQKNQSYQQLRNGNGNYKNKNYKQAEIDYRKALDKNPNYLKAIYNLGNALYKQGRFEEASKYYQEVVNNPNVNKKLAASAWHNLGNIQLSTQKYQESMDAFKNSLKLDPKNERSRYNYEYARKKIQQQKQQQQQQQQQQDQKQQENKQENKRDQKKDDKQNKQKQQQQQRQQQNKKDMERQLNALNQNEKKTTEKLKKEKQSGVKSKLQKDW
jgi:Ca-activated chloride channel homolog